MALPNNSVFLLMANGCIETVDVSKLIQLNFVVLFLNFQILAARIQ